MGNTPATLLRLAGTLLLTGLGCSSDGGDDAKKSCPPETDGPVFAVTLAALDRDLPADLTIRLTAEGTTQTVTLGDITYESAPCAFREPRDTNPIDNDVQCLWGSTVGVGTFEAASSGVGPFTKTLESIPWGECQTPTLAVATVAFER